MTNNIFSKILNFIVWMTGVFVSLAVAFGMIDGVLSIRWIPSAILVVFGWIVVITTLIGVIIGIYKTFSKND
jgi:type III secretory pathway component EscR